MEKKEAIWKFWKICRWIFRETQETWRCEWEVWITILTNAYIVIITLNCGITVKWINLHRNSWCFLYFFGLKSRNIPCVENKNRIVELVRNTWRNVNDSWIYPTSTHKQNVGKIGRSHISHIFRGLFEQILKQFVYCLIYIYLFIDKKITRKIAKC